MCNTNFHIVNVKTDIVLISDKFDTSESIEDIINQFLILKYQSWNNGSYAIYFQTVANKKDLIDIIVQLKNAYDNFPDVFYINGQYYKWVSSKNRKKKINTYKHFDI